MWLFLTVPWVGLQCVIMLFTGHTHLPLGWFSTKRSQVKLYKYICTSALEIISISANYQILILFTVCLAGLFVDWLQSLKQFFINVSYHIPVASLTLMALFKTEPSE